MSLPPKDNWFFRPNANAQAQLRLFCLPYAGAGASVFRTWPADLPPGVEVCAVRLPGREMRLREPSFTRIRPLVAALAEAMQPNLDRPYAIFGHSLGGLISFELARALRRQGDGGPVHLFVSGHRAPHMPAPHPPVHQAPEDVFEARLRGFNGTPEMVFENVELRQLLLPIMRSDFAVWETYRYEDEPPLPCPISAFVGETDSEVSRQEMDAWRRQTDSSFSLRVFPGHHFYLRDSQASLVQTIGQALKAAAGLSPLATG